MKGHGALKTSARARGQRGMYGQGQWKGNIILGKRRRIYALHVNKQNAFQLRYKSQAISNIVSVFHTKASYQLKYEFRGAAHFHIA